MKDISLNDIKNNIPLVSRKKFNRRIEAKDVEIGTDSITIIAGPCVIESRSQIFEIAKAVKASGARMLRGGVFKPLTFPYGDPLARLDSNDKSTKELDRKKIMQKSELFQKAEKRLGYLKEAGEKYDLAVISEILYADSIEMMSKYVDMFQVGYRHMFNMDLIDALAKTEKPIMIKRHYGESLRSLLGVGEHYEARGKNNFVFCERGITAPHTHNVESRAIIDIQAIPALKEYAPSVPVFVDPSHSTFKREYVSAISKAAIAAGADGLLIEVHPEPDKAWVDPLNAIDFEEFDKLMKQIKGIAKVIERCV